jgi:hypothetical protein
METTGSTAELPSYSFELEMSLTDGGRREGIGYLQRRMREMEEMRFLGFHSGGRAFYSVQGRRPSSRPSERRRLIGCLPELHRAASF